MNYPINKSELLYLDIEYFDNALQRVEDDKKIIVDCMISDECNLVCKHCYLGLTPKSNNYVNEQQWLNAINSLINEGIRHFHFSGREPLMDDKMLSILSYLEGVKSNKINNLYYGLISNGMGQSISVYNKLLMSNLDYLEISIEGGTIYHNEIRGDGTYEKVYYNLIQFNNFSKISISTTLTSANLNQYLNMVAEFSLLGITKFYASPVRLIGKASVGRYQKPTPMQLLKLLNDTILYCATHSDVDIKYNLPTEYVAYYLEHECFLSKRIKSHFVDGQKISWQRNRSIVEVNLEYLVIPFFSQIAIGPDGYIIASADKMCQEDYHTYSIGNIKYNSISYLLDNRKKNIAEFIKQQQSEYIKKNAQ